MSERVPHRKRDLLPGRYEPRKSLLGRSGVRIRGRSGWLGRDVKGEVVGPPNPDLEAQLQAFREAVAKKPAGILVSPAQAEPFTEAINQAIEQGIPVICIDSDAPESKRIMFIGTKNYQAGLEGGRLAAQLLEEKGDIAILTIPGQYNLDERVRGYRDY